MNDRFYLESLLTWTKSYCDLLLHGTIEASTPLVFESMNDALFHCLDIQNAIYKQMEQKGWYKTNKVAAEQVKQTKTQIASS